jgi:hypothetical protein
MILRQTDYFALNNGNQLIFVMVKCGVLWILEYYLNELLASKG